MGEDKEYKLTKLLYEIALTIRSHASLFQNKTQDETAEWIRSQLGQCGVYTIPVGMLYGVPCEKEKYDEYIENYITSLKQ